MNQSDLYRSLNEIGCKIISFEDYPAEYGSWRISFIVANIYCEVNSNRSDSFLILRSKNILRGNETITIPSKRLVSDQLEIDKVVDWVRRLKVQAKISESTD